MQYRGEGVSEAGRLLNHALVVYGYVTGKSRAEVDNTLADVGIEVDAMGDYGGELNDTILTMSNNMK